MPDLEILLAQKAEVDAQIEAAHETALAELVAAKDAYRADPTEANKARKAAAVDTVQKVRATLRAGRTGVAVAGDAFAVNGNEG